MAKFKGPWVEAKKDIEFPSKTHTRWVWPVLAMLAGQTIRFKYKDHEDGTTTGWVRVEDIEDPDEE